MKNQPPSASSALQFGTLLSAALGGSYDLVIDARSEREYAEDHLPGAVNLPVVVNDEYAEVGTVHRSDSHRAYLIGVSYALRNISASIESLVARYPKDAALLVYCFRGGKRSKLWFDALSTIGYRVDRLPGGWKAYRGWVREQLEVLPAEFRYRVLGGPTGCGKTRLLNALREVGAQVIDLEDLARHRGSVLGDIPGIEQPTQKWFDSLLVDQMRRLDATRPVWLEAESKKIGEIQIPSALVDAMRASHLYSLSAPMAERVALWREDYSHFERDLAALIERLQYLRPLVGGEEFQLWQGLATERRVGELFTRLMEAHYDPAYSRSLRKNFSGLTRATPVPLAKLDTETLRVVALQLHNDAGSDDK